MIKSHTHMPGTEPATAGGKDREPGEEQLPPYFVEHVRQNNERFDRLEAMIAALAAEEEEEPTALDAMEAAIEKTLQARGIKSFKDHWRAILVVSIFALAVSVVVSVAIVAMLGTHFEHGWVRHAFH